jgi:hypothetical protein
MFDAGTIASEEAILYGASLTYAPGGGFSATAGFTTQFSTPPSGSTYATQVEYAADGSVAYQINRVTTLRASLGWSRTQPSGSASYTQTWSAGTGADFVLSDFTSLSADYSFDRNEGDATTTTDSHTISAGVTISN